MLSQVYEVPFGNVRHMWPEPKGFQLNRPEGLDCWTFLHFLTPVELWTPQGIVPAEPGGCIVYPPGMPQYFRCPTPLVHNWFHFDQTSAAEWQKAGLAEGTVYYPQGSFITELVQKIEAESFCDYPFRERLIDLRISELFILISRSCTAPAPIVSREAAERMPRFRLELLSRLEEDWTVERMAEAVNLSPSHFHALYRQIYGISPIKDLIHARIASAGNLLRDTDLPIGEIAERLGYHNPYHFARQFRQVAGCSPSRFRKRG